MNIRPAFVLLLILSGLALGGCAHRGSRSPQARPVLYPNATFKQVGESRAQEEIDLCFSAARHAGLTPEEPDNPAGQGAAKGAAVIGTAAAVGALVRGRGVDGVVTAGARGAVVGGATGAVAGAFNERPNQTFRSFVQRCMGEKGFDVIGWQ